MTFMASRSVMIRLLFQKKNDEPTIGVFSCLFKGSHQIFLDLESARTIEISAFHWLKTVCEAAGNPLSVRGSVDFCRPTG